MEIIRLFVEFPRNFLLEKFPTYKAKRCVIKGCLLYVVNIQNFEEEKKHKIEGSPVLNEFKDVFLE